MSVEHLTISELTGRGWRVCNLNKYTHSDGRELYRNDRARWYLAQPGREPKYVGSTLKVAIETVIRMAGGRSA